MAQRLRRSLLFALLSGLVIVLALVLTPPVHRLLVGWGLLPEDSFTKVLRRLLLIPLLIVLFAFLRPWRDGNLRSYGLLGPRARLRPAVTGFVATAFLFIALLVWQFAEGWLRWEAPILWGRALYNAVRWLVVGLLVGVIEEWFFRGWMFRRFRRLWPTARSALLVAVIFALVHAFNPSHLKKEVSHDVSGALDALGTWLTHLVDPVGFGPAFLGLALFSLVLGGAYRATGTLWTAVGIHAGGVWVLRTHEHFTDRTPLVNWAGSKNLYDGAPTWILLALVALWLWTRPPVPQGADPREAPSPSI